MSERTDGRLYETRERFVRGLRIYFWIAMAVTLPAFAVFGIAIRQPLVAGVAFLGACGMMLLNGYRTVIGLRVYEDRLQIVTPLAEPEFPWQRVRLKGYPLLWVLGRTDIYVSGKPVFFAAVHWFGAIRNGLRAAEQHLQRLREERA